MTEKDSLLDINVGGQVFTTKQTTLSRNFPESRLAQYATSYAKSKLPKSSSEEFTIDSSGRLFLDRDPKIFSLVLQYLRDLPNKSTQYLATDLHFPHETQCQWISHLSALDRARFEEECNYFKLPLPKNFSQDHLNPSSVKFLPRCSSENAIYREGRNSALSRIEPGPKYLSLGYRASYAVNRDAFSNDKFRRITRITVCGNAAAAKEVFDDDINDSRDPDRQPTGGYTSRYYLKHNHLEKAFEALSAKGFKLVASTSSGSKTLSAHTDEYKQWTAYLEYVFYRE